MSARKRQKAPPGYVVESTVTLARVMHKAIKIEVVKPDAGDGSRVCLSVTAEAEKSPLWWTNFGKHLTEAMLPFCSYYFVEGAGCHGQIAWREKGKGGRIKLEAPLCKSIRVKVTEREHREFMSRVDESGLSMSEAIRLIVFSERIPRKVYGGLDVSASDAYQKLQPLQSNLNQLCHHLNSSRADIADGVNLPALAALVELIEVEVRTLRAEIVAKNPYQEAANA